MVARNEPEGPFSKLTIHSLFFTLFGCRVESGVSPHSTTLLQRVVYITHCVRNMYEPLHLQRVRITHFFHMVIFVLLFTCWIHDTSILVMDIGNKNALQNSSTTRIFYYVC